MSRSAPDVALKFYLQGTKFAEDALRYDRTGQDYNSAMRLYTKSVEYFIAGLRRDRRASRTTLIKSKVSEFLSRAERLKTLLAKVRELKKRRAMAMGASNDDAVRENVKRLFEEAAAHVPDVKWDEVAGANAAKSALVEAVVLPYRFPSIFKDGRTPWKGILLYGPPGTGKTHLAKALANKSGHKLVAISASDLMSKYQGESEKMVKAIMEEARRQKPCIIFIDEIDSVGRKRSENEKESTRRVKNEILRQLDGFETNNSGVVVLAATNAPWEIDAALRRRFEKRIYVPLPNAEAREAIFQVHLEGEASTLTKKNYRRLAQRTKGFSGSDIANVCREALMEPVRELMRATHFKRIRVRDESGITRTKFAPANKSSERGAIATSMFQINADDLHCRAITANDFDLALSRIKSTVKESELTRHVDFANKFGDGHAMTKQTMTSSADERSKSEDTSEDVDTESFISRISSWLFRARAQEERVAPLPAPPEAQRRLPPPPPPQGHHKRPKTAIPV